MICLEDYKRIQSEHPGFVLHPLSNPNDAGKSPGKRPLLNKWQELKQTPIDINKYVEGGCNVGLVCGEVSGVIVIDFDHELFIPEIFNDFEVKTLRSGRISGRGHIYFKYDRELKAQKHHLLGLEILSDNNNAVLPPSIHKSGDVYKWAKDDAPISPMPQIVKENLNRLFKTETELKQITSKCRHCFRKILKDYPDNIPEVHGSDGREMMLAVCADMKANGANEEHARMFAKLMYREKFDEGRTLQEWGNIDPAKTWTCETLKTKLPAYVDLVECEKCEERRTAFKNRPDLAPAPPKITDPDATTDLSNAKRFVQLHQRNIRFVPDWDRWIVWDGKRWVEKKKDKQMVPYVEEMITEIKRDAKDLNSTAGQEKLRKHADMTESENRIMACIRLAASQPEICASPDDFDKDKYLLNFQNGTVDLHTGELREFKREDMITRICAVPYIPSEIPLWKGFLMKIFNGDTDIIEYMQKFMGMAFTGDISEELFHIFHGGGANGKTTEMKTLNNILGSGYFRVSGVETLLKRGQKAIANDIARLRGARIVWVNEPEYDDVLTEGKIKKMVSNERILGEMKFKEPEEFDPQYALIMTTNPKPRVRGTGKGWQRRVRFIPFDVEISDAEKDIHFADKLKDELSGIAVWIIQGALKWQKEGLIPPEKILQATHEFHQDSDKFAELFNNIFIKDVQAITPFIILYTVYEAWATNEKMRIMTKNAFSRVISDHGFKDKPGRFPDGRTFKGYEGISVTHFVLESVTDFLTAPDHEKETKKERITYVTHQVTNLFYSEPHVRTENNSNISNIGNSIAIINNNELVTSVTLVTDIIKLIKDKYDLFNKPDSIQDLSRLKINMRDYIINELNGSLAENQEIPQNEVIDRVITDFCRARQWE